MSNNLLVPIDFQKATADALKYAIQFAERNQYNITALHIIKDEKNREEAESNLNDLLNEINVPASVSINALIRVGNISDDIGDAAEEIGSSFIIMGTHGAPGLNRWLGSKAIQVISESEVPFIVLQEGTLLTDCKKIALTIDLEKESVQVVKVAVKLAKEFDSEIVLVGGNHSDPVLKQKVAINVNIARKTLSDQGINSSVVLLERKNFLDNFVDFCKENKVDIIAATYYADTFSIFSKKFVQHLLENEADIPVLTLNSDAISIGSQYSFL